MDRFGPTGKVSKKRVHLLRWTNFPGRTGWNFGWMDRATEIQYQRGIQNPRRSWTILFGIIHYISLHCLSLHTLWIQWVVTLGSLSACAFTGYWHSKKQTIKNQNRTSNRCEILWRLIQIHPTMTKKEVKKSTFVWISMAHQQGSN